MTAFRVMFLKELRSIYRNPMTFGLLLLMPFLLMAVISKAFEPLFTGRQSFEVPLVDLDRTPESDALAADLDTLDSIDIVRLDWGHANLTAADADNILDDENHFTLIVIPAGFAASLANAEPIALDLYADPGQEAYSGLVRDQVQGRLQIVDLMHAFKSVLAVESSPDDAARMVDSEIAPRVDNPLLKVQRMFTEKRKATPANYEQTVPGFAIMFTFWLSAFVAASVYSEKREYHTWRRTLAAPVPRATVVASRVLAYVLVGMAQMTLLFVLGWAVFGLSLGDHPYALLPVFFAMALVTTGFGILMTTLVRDFVALNSIMNLGVIVAAAAGGTLVPLFLLPGWLRTISPLSPHYWAMDASLGVLTLGYGLLDVLPDVLALLGFAAAFFTLSLWRFRFVD